MARSPKSEISKVLTESLEDYLEVIIRLEIEKKVVRVKDISKMMDVKMPSVNAAMKQLQEKGYINQEKYGYIELTEKGEKCGKKIYCRHTLLKSFLIDILKIDSGTAESEACRMEHVLSKATTQKIDRLYKFLQNNFPDGKWMKEKK